jgi:hypothetical protein
MTTSRYTQFRTKESVGGSDTKLERADGRRSTALGGRRSVMAQVGLLRWAADEAVEVVVGLSVTGSATESQSAELRL